MVTPKSKANLENILRLWLDVVGLSIVRYDAGISATALMMPRSKSTRLLLLGQDDDGNHCETYLTTVSVYDER